MSSTATFQNQAPDRYSSDRSPPNVFSHVVSPFNSPPPLTKQSIVSPRQSPIRRKPVPQSLGSASTLPAAPLNNLGRTTPEHFPKPPTHRPSLPPALKSPEPTPPTIQPVKVFDGYPCPDSPVLPSPHIISGGLNRSYREEQPRSHPGQWDVATARVSAPEPSQQQRAFPRPPVSSNHARFISVSSLNTSTNRSRIIEPATTTQHIRSASTTATENIKMAATMMPPQQPHIAIPDLSGSIETDDSRKSKSPNRFTNFFRWGSQSEQGGNVGPPEVRIDEHGNRASLAPSVAISPKSKYLPSAIDTSLANGRDGGLSPRTGVFSEVDMFPNSPTTVEAIEQEVRMVSADLAASIRREMDLENLIERLQAEAAARGDGETNTSIDQRRTSDYFSDIGTPVRIGSRDVEKMDAEKIVRRVEQEKAQMRLELLEQVQAEREKRRLAEHQARELEDLVNKTSGIAPVSPDALPKILNLEKQLSEAKRRLSEERSMKENFQNLLTSLKAELDACQAERDNFKNEIVPELQSRVEGLETEAAENRKLSYDTTRLQQEIEKLKSENASLTASNKEKSDSLPDFKIAPLPKLQQLQTGGSAPKNRYSMSGPPTSFIPSTGRNSMIAPMSPMSGLAAKDRESLLERLKDVEAQRDALHKALKGLRDRQVYESKKARAKIAALETERERARNPSKQRSRDTEVSALRREVDRLRQRADDALDQKFVCERSLGTLKMDLEKAEQETTTLRALLQEHDDLLAQHDELRNSHQRLSKEISELKHGRSRSNSNPSQPSMSLQQAYKDLQILHERSLQRLDQLEADGESLDDAAKLAAANAANAATIEKLRTSLAEAETERDLAIAESAGHRARADSLARAESQHMVEERSLAVQLRISSERCEELAIQVRAQIESNAALRDRLAECIQRGENEQKASAKKINDLQNKLRQLEDRVVEAQQMAEDAVVAHEDEIRRIRETHTSQLKRLRASTLKVPSPGSRSPITSPLLRTPNLEWTSVRKLSQADASKTEVLSKRIKDLERALGDADDEMSEVVQRMNAAQIEVLQLQTERDEALRSTKRMKAELAVHQAKLTGFL